MLKLPFSDILFGISATYNIRMMILLILGSNTLEKAQHVISCWSLLKRVKHRYIPVQWIVAQGGACVCGYNVMYLANYQSHGAVTFVSSAPHRGSTLCSSPCCPQSTNPSKLSLQKYEDKTVQGDMSKERCVVEGRQWLATSSGRSSSLHCSCK